MEAFFFQMNGRFGRRFQDFPNTNAIHSPPSLGSLRIMPSLRLNENVAADLPLYATAHAVLKNSSSLIFYYLRCHSTSANALCALAGSVGHFRQILDIGGNGV